jgi:hypothetical protein
LGSLTEPAIGGAEPGMVAEACGLGGRHRRLLARDHDRCSHARLGIESLGDLPVVDRRRARVANALDPVVGLRIAVVMLRGSRT